MAIKLPSIEQDVEIDTSDLARAIVAAEAFGKAMERALKVDSKSFKKSLADINAELENTERQTRSTADSFTVLGDAINRMNTRIQATRSGIANLRQDMANLDRDSKNVGRNFDAISAAVDKLANSTRRGHSSLRDYVNELSKIGQNLGNAGAGLRGVIGNVDDLDDSLRRSSNTIRDYNDALGNMKSGTGGTGPRMDEDFDDTANSANRAEKELDELRSAAAKLAAALAALEGVIEVVNDRLDNLGDGANNAEIEHLKSEIEELKRELAEVTTAALPASQAVRKFGNNAREAAGDVALLAAASAALNAALAPEIIIKTSELGTMFSAITGVVGAIGGALGQIVAGGIGLGTALAPIANLAGIIPSMVTGVALLGVTIKSAFNTDVTNEFTESIKAGKKNIEELGNRLVTVIQGQTTPAFRRLVDSAKELSPILETGFRSMGRVVQEVMDDISGNFFLGNPEFQDRFAKLFDSASVQARNYGYVATNSLFAVTIAAAKGIPVAEKLSETFKDMSNRFLNFIRRAETDGSLEAAFERGYQTLMRVTSVVGSLGTGFANLGRVARSVGLDESILASFERGAAGIRNFGRTYREVLTETFSNAKGLFDELGGLISQIGRTIMLDLGRINLAPLARELTSVVELLGKMALPAGNALVEGFRDIFAAVNDARGPLVNISTVLSGTLASLGDFGATIIPRLIGPLQ